MPITSTHCTFSTGEPNLSELLEQAATGKLQLPDFQRGWVWDDNHIRSLIASVSLSYPIGAVMLLEVGGEGVRFKPRALEGASVPPEVKPERLILDGQQRLTSLFLTLKSGKPVPTRTERGLEISRVYFLDIAKCLDKNLDRMDAVISLAPDRRITSDFGRTVELDVSTQAREFDLGLIPLATLFDQEAYASWRRAYQRKFRQDEARLDQFDNFESEVYHRFLQYRIPTIEMKKQTPKEAVCQVFEKVNTGGVTLTVFELLTATFAADDFNLRDDWDTRSKRLREQAPINEISATDFLTSLTLLASYERNRQSPLPKDKRPAVNCKRKDVLNLTLAEYRTDANRLESALFKAARFLNREKVFDTRNLAYATQLIPLAAICAILGDLFENDSVRSKLARWYWCGVFGEMYGGANESRYAFDIVEVLDWIEGSANEPRTIRDSNFAPIRLLSLQTRNSAAYKGLMVLLMQRGSADFLNGDQIELTSYFDEAVDIHHLFPRDYCEKLKLPRERWNSVVNKAPLTARTNRIIGGRAPSIYLSRIQEQHGIQDERMNNILASHAVNPALMRADNFAEFIKTRAGVLLDLVEKATGKQISGRDSEETVTAFGGPVPIRGIV